MDATTAAAPTGLVGWIMANGQIVLFIAQLLFWLVLSVSALWAAIVLNKYVSFVTRWPATPQNAAEDKVTVSVEEFVE